MSKLRMVCFLTILMIVVFGDTLSASGESYIAVHLDVRDQMEWKDVWIDYSKSKYVRIKVYNNGKEAFTTKKLFYRKNSPRVFEQSKLFLIPVPSGKVSYLVLVGVDFSNTKDCGKFYRMPELRSYKFRKYLKPGQVWYDRYRVNYNEYSKNKKNERFRRRCFVDQSIGKPLGKHYIDDRGVERYKDLRNVYKERVFVSLQDFEGWAWEKHFDSIMVQ